MEVGSIFYLHSFVSIATYFTYTKMGGTLPMLKNEIEDVCLCPAVRKRNL